MIRVSRAIIVMQLNKIKLSLLIHKARLTLVVRLPGVPGSPRRTRRRLPGVPGSKKKKFFFFFQNV